MDGLSLRLTHAKQSLLAVTSLSPHQTGEACVTPTLDEEVPLHFKKTMFSGRERGLCYANPTPSVHTEATGSPMGRPVPLGPQNYTTQDCFINGAPGISALFKINELSEHCRRGPQVATFTPEWCGETIWGPGLEIMQDNAYEDVHSSMVSGGPASSQAGQARSGKMVTEKALL